jgi:hypothetical protein
MTAGRGWVLGSDVGLRGDPCGLGWELLVRVTAFAWWDDR